MDFYEFTLCMIFSILTKIAIIIVTIFTRIVKIWEFTLVMIVVISPKMANLG